jgi:hypothetical protein
VDPRRAERNGGIEPIIARDFVKLTRRGGLLKAYRQCLADTRGRRTHLPDTVKAQASSLISRFRTDLARASVAALEPDLIILDEFQRFRDLMDPDTDTEAADLARSLFGHGQARVLLLSATPIKAFTLAEEAAGGDNHERDLIKVLEFLAEGSVLEPTTITKDLAEFRSCAINGLPVADVRRRLETRLLSVMSRTERPRVGEDGMLDEEDHPVGPVPATDLAGWAGLHALAAAVDAPVTLDYWKSAPYFANFLDGTSWAINSAPDFKTAPTPRAPSRRSVTSKPWTTRPSNREQRSTSEVPDFAPSRPRHSTKDCTNCCGSRRRFRTSASTAPTAASTQPPARSN